MFLQGHLESHSPMRRPHWRLARALEMLRQRPQPVWPKRADDHPIRIYLQLVLGLNNAGLEAAQREDVIRIYPDAYQAHAIWYSTQFATRQQLEARLLTSESFEEIGKRLCATPKAIEYYEQMFFNVRDRVKCTDWISNSLRGRMCDEQEWGCSEADAQRGYVMRLFAYHGGPLVLDAFLNVLSLSHSPLRARDVEKWCNDGLKNAIMTTAAAAAIGLDLTRKNMMQVMKLAIKSGISIRTSEDVAKENEYFRRMINAYETIQRGMNGGAAAQTDKANKAELIARLNDADTLVQTVLR